jgi:hypothetical protein
VHVINLSEFSINWIDRVSWSSLSIGLEPVWRVLGGSNVVIVAAAAAIAQFMPFDLWSRSRKEKR